MTITDVLSGAARWCVVEGDCLEVLPRLDVGAVRAVITDGPYGIGDDPRTNDDGPYVEALRLTQGCASRAFFGYAETLVEWIVRLGWGRPREWITWYASNAEAKAGGKSPRSLPKCAEHVAIYGQIGNVRELRRERSAGGAKLSRKAGLSHHYSPDRTLRETAQVGDVWTDASPGIGFHSAARLHPNEKPVSLMTKLVTLVTDPGELVLDPFAGSGTTGVAALRLGRRAILIERDPTYSALCRERMRAEEAGHSLQAHRAGQLTLLGSSPA